MRRLPPVSEWSDRQHAILRRILIASAVSFELLGTCYFCWEAVKLLWLFGELNDQREGGVP